MKPPQIQLPRTPAPGTPSVAYLQSLVDEEFDHPRRNPGLREFVDRWLLANRRPAVQWPVDAPRE